MKIIHVGQTHKLPIKMIRNRASLLKEIEEVTRSQFKVAEIIRQHPEWPVVSEGRNYNIYCGGVYAQPKELGKIFPSVFPKKSMS